MGLALVLMPIAARYLGDAGYGKYGLASTIMFFVLILNDLGVNTFVTREVARKRDEANKYLINSILIKSAGVLFNGLLLVGFLALSGYDAEKQTAILIFAAYGIATSFVKLAIGVFEAFERMQYETLILILEKVLTTGLGVYVLVTGKGLFVFCGVFVFGGVVSALLSFYLIHLRFKRIRLDIDLGFCRDLIKESLPFGYSMMIAMIYNNTGILMLSFMATDEVIGWYFAAFRLLTQTNVIPTILVTSMFPALSRAYLGSDLQFRDWYTKGFKYLSFLAIPLIAGTILLAGPIVHLVFGEEFGNTALALRVLAIAAGLLFINIYLTGIFKAANRQRTLVQIQLVGLVINILLNYFLIKNYSYLGAAWATVLTEGIIFIVSFSYIYFLIARLNEVGFFAKSALATGAMIGVILLTQNLNVLFVVPLSILIYVSSLYLLRGFILQEFMLLKQNA